MGMVAAREAEMRSHRYGEHVGAVAAMAAAVAAAVAVRVEAARVVTARAAARWGRSCVGVAPSRPR